MFAPLRGNARHKRVGAHLVEFALVVPVFFLFILTMIEVGRGMMVSTLATNAARAGCRIGVVPGRASSDVNATVDSLLTAQGINQYTTTVTVNGNSTNVSAAQSGDTITVTVAIPIAQASWLPGLSFINGNITGRYSIPHE